jgi:hypothetical protein
MWSPAALLCAALLSLAASSAKAAVSTQDLATIKGRLRDQCVPPFPYLALCCLSIHHLFSSARTA